MKPARYCPHGGNVRLGPCPDCANEKMRRRQRKADRARFKAQLARIRGANWKPMS